MRMIKTQEGIISIGTIKQLKSNKSVILSSNDKLTFLNNSYFKVVEQGTNLLKDLTVGEIKREWHLSNGNIIRITFSNWNTSRKRVYVDIFVTGVIDVQALLLEWDMPNGLNDMFLSLYDVTSDSAYYAGAANYSLIYKYASAYDYTFDYTTLSTKNYNDFVQGSEVVINFGENSTTGGGFGEWDISSDAVDFPNLPTGSALNTGLINMYKCSDSDLRDFGEYLWGNSFFNEISKIFNDPMEAFVSLNLFPVTPTISDTKTPIKIGNVFASKSASEFVTAYPLTNQYVEFDCGTVNINEFFGSALDYNPYTQVQIYLPFIGFQNLSVDDIMDGQIKLKYHIDMLTGTCTAMIKCEKSSKYNLASVLYSFAGSMNMSVPISASNYGQAMGTLINGITGIGIGAAMGGAPAMLGVSATGSAMNIMNTKATVQRSGGIVMNAGALGNLTPYIIITRPVQHKPEDYQKFKGWENNITYTLSTLQGKGYTEIMYTHIEGLTATDEEKAEIEALLKDGVIL